MPIDWSTLRSLAPTTLVPARELAHNAVQWAVRAARANLTPALDDSHTSLSWDARAAALVTQSMPDDVRVGVGVATPTLLFMRRGEVADSLELAGKPKSIAGAWLDTHLARAHLKAASGQTLPYEVPAADIAKAAALAPQLAVLGRWFAAAAEVLEAQRAKYAKYKPGASPVRCWPHHFDIAVLVGLEEGDAEHAKSIGFGISPGDGYYPEPYFYLSPYPMPETKGLPSLPPGGRWHTKDFFAAVATATDLLALRNPRAGLEAIIDAAFAEGARRLHVR
ncbi:MAG: hypothetical protein ACREU5_00410 [Burkholderiales bacterium]